MLLKGEPLLPPEARSLLISSINHASKQNLVATAVVFQDVEYETTVKLFWRSIYAQTNLPYAFFQFRQDAEVWLGEQLDAARHQHKG